MKSSLRSMIFGGIFCFCATGMVAQDTLRVVAQDSLRVDVQDSLRVGGDTIWVVATDYSGVYADTVMAEELTEMADMDDYLLELVAQQSMMLYEAELARQDSILMDSLKTINAELEAEHPEIPTLVVAKSIVRDVDEDRRDILSAIRQRQSRWRREATLMAQLTQNYVTDNWYQGGNSNFSMLALASGKIGYYGEKFTWENSGEWREGFSTVKGDSLRKVNTTDDLLKLYTKAGGRIHKQVNVTFSGEFEMHFCPVYKANEKNLKSGFASPIRLNLGLGIDYKPVPGLSVLFSPLAYKMVYVNDTIRMLPSDFGIKQGNLLSDVGSSVRLEYTWTPLREISLESKFYLYTNYKSVELDLEVNCNFIINRFLSARVTLHPRYESAVIREGDDHAKIQFKELISIGFAHKFR